MSALLALVVATILFFAAAPARAITNGVDPDPTDTRYDAVGALSFAHWLGQDPSNANAQDHNWFCNATLLSPTLVVTANHCVDSPGTQYALRFRRHATGTLGTVQAGVASFHHVLIDSWLPVAGSDMRFGTLKEPVTHIAPIPALSLATDLLAKGTPVRNAGWGKQGPGFNMGPKDRLLLCDTTLTQASLQGLGFDVNGLAPAGCSVNMHDSGSPLLYVGPNGELRTLGVVGTVGGAQSFAKIHGDPAYPLVHTPYEGGDLAVRVSGTGHIATAGTPVHVEVSVVDAGAVPPSSTTVVKLELVADALPTIALGSVAFTPSEIALGPKAHDAATPKDLPAGTWSVRTTIETQNAEPDAIPHNHIQTTAPTFSFQPNPPDVEALFTGWFDAADALGGPLGLAKRANGNVDVIAAFVPFDIVAIATDTRLDESGGLSFSSAQGEAKVTQNAQGNFKLTTSLPDAWITTATQGPAFGPSGHARGIYVGEASDGAQLGASVTTSGEFALVGRKGAAAFFASGTVAPDDTLVFDLDAGTSFLAWDEEHFSMRMTIGGGADVPAGTLWLVAPPKPIEPPADADGDGFDEDVDCDDLDADVHPGASEPCNGIDDDCDGTVDEDPNASGCDAAPEDPPDPPPPPTTPEDDTGCACATRPADPLANRTALALVAVCGAFAIGRRRHRPS